MGKLTQAAVRALDRPGRHGDGATLYLHVAPGGTKSWVQRITIDGKQRDIGLGPWPLVPIAEARELATDNRRIVRRGGDPLADKRRARTPTFRQAALRTLESKRADFRSQKAATAWLQQLERCAFPTLGDVRVDQVDREAILRVLSPIWAKQPASARKLRQRISATLRWAEAHGYVDRDLSGDAIAGALPRRQAAARHHRSLPYQETGDALEAIESSTASTAAKLCLRFIVLTAARSGEARGATWSEIDLATAEWCIPSERMKAAREHRVPLSEAALAVLRQVRELRDGSDLVFPSPMYPGKAMSDGTLVKVLRSVGLGERATVHGFRSTFRDWASERTNAAHAVMELSLAHTVGSKVEQAYARSDLLSKRRQLMRQWADFVTGTSGRKVVQLRS